MAELTQCPEGQCSFSYAGDHKVYEHGLMRMKLIFFCKYCLRLEKKDTPK